MIIGDWVLDRFNFGVGKFDVDTQLTPTMGVPAGTHWLRFEPDPAESPAASLVVIFSDKDWDSFKKRVAAADLVVVGAGELRGIGNGTTPPH